MSENNPEPQAEPIAADVTPSATANGATSNGPAEPRKRVKLVLCPYCGHTQHAEGRCAFCGGLFEPLSRRATQIAMGPWYIRDKSNPFRPGCAYEILVKMIRGGAVTPTTVIRGPSTRQFWSIARNVPGVAHLLGYCHACGAHVPKDATDCPVCEASFKPPKHRNELGLQFPNRRAAESAQRALNRHLGITTSDPGESDILETADDSGNPIDTAPAPPDSKSPSGDLLGDVLGDDLSATPVPENVEALSFAPTGKDEPTAASVDEAPTAVEPPMSAVPPRPATHWGIWVLVAINVIVALAVVYFVANSGSN